MAPPALEAEVSLRLHGNRPEFAVLNYSGEYNVFQPVQVHTTVIHGYMAIPARIYPRYDKKSTQEVVWNSSSRIYLAVNNCKVHFASVGEPALVGVTVLGALAALAAGLCPVPASAPVALGRLNGCGVAGRSLCRRQERGRKWRLGKRAKNGEGRTLRGR